MIKAMFVVLISFVLMARAGAQVGNSGTRSVLYTGYGPPQEVCGVLNGQLNDANTEYVQIDGVGGKRWLCISLDGNNWAWYHIPTSITGITVAIGGALLLLNQTATGTASVPGAIAGQNCIAGTSDGTHIPNLLITCDVSAANVVTVTLMAIGLASQPPAKTYNVKIFQ